MIYASISVSDPLGGDIVDVTIPIGDHYGLTAEVAHAILGLCLLGAELPLVVDVSGDVWYVPATLLRGFRTWEGSGGTYVIP